MLLTLLYRRPNSRKVLPWEAPQSGAPDIPPMPSEQVVFVYNGTAAQALEAYLKKDQKPNVKS